MTYFRTAESVSPRHPDKLCDQISDAILDAYLAEDPDTRSAIEVMGGHGAVYVTGEITSRAQIDIRPIVNRLVGDINLSVNIVKQSPEIARGVDQGGAGDQGIMVGYACRETPEFLPLEVVLSRQLNQLLYTRWPFDGKTQVTLIDGKISAVVASFQTATHDDLRQTVIDWLEMLSLPVVDNPKLHINPAGDWQVGGFDADVGLTGRKLVVDNYGPYIPIGGGCFSGKDPSKVDRSAAYMARKIALDHLNKHGAEEVFCHLAYAIGAVEPVKASVQIDGIEEPVRGYDLRPNAIIDRLDLKRPQYEKTATYGHFGYREFTWES